MLRREKLDTCQTPRWAHQVSSTQSTNYHWLRAAAACAVMIGLFFAAVGAKPVAPERRQPQSPAKITVDRQLADSGWAVFEPVIVDYRIDGPGFPTAGQDGLERSQAACTFDVECEDDDPCTDQRCLIDYGAGPGSGLCDYDPVPDGEAGGCDDGIFCNGREFCDSTGHCTIGPPATCCASPTPPPGAEYCTETLGRCDATSTQPGARCATDAECGNNGECLHCVPVCASDGDCGDGLGCNGVETCGGGDCSAGTPLCGEGARCSEKRCKNAKGIDQQPLKSCDTDAGCNSLQGYTCQPDPLCFLGRCCSNESEPACSSRRLLQSPPAACLGTGGNWYPGDLGFETGSACGGVHPYEPGLPLGCPKYGSGIAQTTADPPGHPIAAGPVSLSPASVLAPAGPGTPLYRLGDDYDLSNASHMRLRAFRFAGAMSENGALIFEFWDDAGRRVEDITVPVLAGTGVRAGYLSSPLTIPPSGYLTAAVAAPVSPNAKFTWLSAGSVTVGGNESAKLFVNDDPNGANFLSPAPGILSFELIGEKVAEPLGACCQPGGACADQTAWVCAGQGGQFQGVGTQCPQAACATGACCDAATGWCSPTAEGDCAGPDTFLGYGRACDPNCCPQTCDPAADPGGDPNRYDCDCSDGKCYTGADDALDAVAHIVPSLGAFDPPYVITITGDNTNATSPGDDPDACVGPAESPNDDAGWFENFGFLGSCIRLRVDFCCSEPHREFEQVLLYRDFDCARPITPAPDPYRYGEPAEGHGEPYCDGDNYWATYGLLGPGHYTVAIPSPAVGPRGPYQIHATFEACPDAACCTPGGSCQDGVNLFECEAMNGVFLAPPNRFPAIGGCFLDPCATGSCCDGPGLCRDEISGVPIDIDDCNGLGGTYKGGLKCEGCVCQSNPSYSCNDSSDCATGNGGPGGACDLGCSGQAKAQPNPCPICEFEGESNCNLWDDPSGFSASISELGLGSGLVAADDFIPGPGLTQVSQVCVYGSYFFIDPDQAGVDCGGNVPDPGGDHFRVRVMRSTPEGLPDSSPAGIVGTSTATHDKAIVPGAKSLQVGDGYETWGYQLTLATPITGLNDNGATRYWLEVANNLDPWFGCYWLWSQISDESPQGNNFSAAGSGWNGYVVGSPRPADMAFCLPDSFETPAEPQHPCCLCDGGCLVTTLAECNGLDGTFHIDESSCTGLCPQDLAENDDCADASVISVGTHSLSTFCAHTDGVNPVVGEDGPFDLEFDIWYEFHAAQDCTLRVDTCATGDVFDSALALFSNGTSECACPMTQALADATFLVAANDTCVSAFLGPAALIEWPATAGQCFMLRVGQFCCPEGPRGSGLVHISCGPAICGDGAVQSFIGEECDGANDAACPGRCNPPGDPQPCQCGPIPECGNGVREATEQCDPGNPIDPPDDENCPGLCQPNCTCEVFCGDEIRMYPEECDGPADTSCGGVAGRCLTDCTCPPVVCGNGFRDPGEECDAGAGSNSDGDEDDFLCPSECRLPGDPAGECTCQCGPCVLPADAQPAPGDTQMPRFFSMVIPEQGPGPIVPELTAIRVTLASLNRPRFCCTDASAASCNLTPCAGAGQCPGGFPVCADAAPGGAPNYSCYEGNVRYVNSFAFPIAGGSLDCGDTDVFNTSYKCATLGCEPEFRNWAADLATPGIEQPQVPGLIFVTGDVALPSSSFIVEHVTPTASRDGLAATACPPPGQLVVKTSRWGDVTSAGNGPPDGRADVLDISALTNKLVTPGTAFLEPRLWLKQLDPAPDADPINVLDLSDCVDGVKEKPYPCTRRALQACPADGHGDVCSPDACP